MRWLPLLLVLASTHLAGLASAHPVRQDWDRVPYKPKAACKATSDWKTFATCQFDKRSVELLHDSRTAKLVAYAVDGNRTAKRLELYVLRDGAWQKLALYAETNPTIELLSFKPMAGDLYRLDMGFASQTWVTLDEFASRPAVIRRGYTYVCGATTGCPSVVSSCDVLVRGKSVASFRGEVVWDGRMLRVHGIAQNTNRYCPAPPGLVAPDEVP